MASKAAGSAGRAAYRVTIPDGTPPFGPGSPDVHSGEDWTERFAPFLEPADGDQALAFDLNTNAHRISSMRAASDALDRRYAPEPILDRVLQDLQGLVRLGGEALARLELLKS